ncbi:MAG: hypothetical protein PGN23_15740 [Sphingomonas adhaesiva]|uniref:hypothetical protein n=1 Tax=Sphingomonas adhaesiva TaxID=28212 RepID=UPI002FFA5EF8
MMLEVDERWGCRCTGYHVQGRPDPASVDALLALQRRLAARSDVPLRLIPPAALHLSVMTMLPAFASIEGRDARWQRIATAWRMKRPLLPAFSLVFHDAIFTHHALIVSTHDLPMLLVDVRRRLGEVMAAADEIAPTYDRAHITLARYARAGAMPQPVAIELRASIDTVRVVRERRYPSLECEEVDLTDPSAPPPPRVPP